MIRICNLAFAVFLALSASDSHAFSVAPFGTRVRQGTVLFMASKLERKPNSSVEVTLTAPAEATKAAYDKACTELSKEITIPGFRKGAKIPPQVLEAQMSAKGGKNALKVEAINSLLAQLIEPALKDEHGLDPIGQPTLVKSAEEIAETFVAGEPVEMTVKCDVWPDISWKEVQDQEKPYFGLEGTYKRKPFNKEKFNIALNDLKDRYATLEPMEEGGVLAMGDACVVNMEGYMAQADGETKGDPLPNAASGDNVEIILGPGRYMEGLVEGLVGASVGDTRTVGVSFPPNLKDKTLAGKKAIFDVTILEASHRSLPDVTDEFANNVRAGLTAESLQEELQKAVDEEDAKEFVGDRNRALAEALAERLEVEVPDTLVTNQAREKYAMMMTEMRDGGVTDEEIKKQITPENFIKYKNLVQDDIIRDFRVSMATDEIARLENIEVPDYQVEEQIQNIKKDAGADENFDENMVRGKVEATLQRNLVMDFLAEHAKLQVEFTDADEEEFDQELLDKLADESIEREKELAAKAAAEAEQTDA